MNEINDKESWLATYQSIIQSSIDSHNCIATESFKGIIEYSKIAINGAFILNGSAAIAILYNTKSLEGRWEILVMSCAIGAVLAVSSAAVSYLAQRYYFINDKINAMREINSFFEKKFNTICNINVPYKAPEYKKPRFADILSGIAFFLWGSSIFSFAYATTKSMSSM